MKTNKHERKQSFVHENSRKEKQITGRSNHVFEHRQGLSKLPSKCPTRKNTESNGSRELLLGDQTKRKRTEDTELNVCKRAEISSDTRRGQRADQQVTHTSRASGDQHAQTPTTRSEAMSPGICDRPCHQQPRDARRTTSARHIGGVPTQDRTP